ncbi:hypothetical protein GCM10010399_88420 [Dactylosporangium fulvum]
MCHVCGLDLWAVSGPVDEHFVLVHFGGDAPVPEGWVGHPPNAVWFCREHASVALERAAMPYQAALAEIDAVVGRSVS